MVLWYTNLVSQFLYSMCFGKYSFIAIPIFYIINQIAFKLLMHNYKRIYRRTRSSLVENMGIWKTTFSAVAYVTFASNFALFYYDCRKLNVDIQFETNLYIFVVVLALRYFTEKLISTMPFYIKEAKGGLGTSERKIGKHPWSFLKQCSCEDEEGASKTICFVP